MACTASTTTPKKMIGTKSTPAIRTLASSERGAPPRLSPTADSRQPEQTDHDPYDDLGAASAIRAKGRKGGHQYFGPAFMQLERVIREHEQHEECERHVKTETGHTPGQHENDRHERPFCVIQHLPGAPVPSDIQKGRSFSEVSADDGHAKQAARKDQQDVEGQQDCQKSDMHIHGFIPDRQSETQREPIGDCHETVTPAT